MASYTAPTLHATGDDLAVTDYNAVANNTVFLYQKPYTLAESFYGSAITSGVVTQLTLTTVSESGYGFTVSGGNIVLPLTGVYTCGWNAVISIGAGSGMVQTAIHQNGAAVMDGSSTDSGLPNPASSGSGLIYGSANDTVGLYIYQTSGNNTLTINGGAPYTYVHMSFVGSQ